MGNKRRRTYVGVLSFAFTLFFPASLFAQTAPRAVYESTAKGYWIPSQKEVLLVESLLPPLFSKESALAPTPPTLPLEKYGIQYRGVTIGGKKRIEAFGFCNAWGKTIPSLQTELFEVDDGGSCYFHLLFDPKTRTFLTFSFNGEG